MNDFHPPSRSPTDAHNSRLTALVKDVLPADNAQNGTGDPPPQSGGQGRSGLSLKKRKQRFVLVSITSLVLVVLLVSILFAKLASNFGRNTAAESANHLEEITHQIKLYVEEKIDTNWRTAYAVSNGLRYWATGEPQEMNLRNFLQSERDIWSVDDIIIYTADGTGIRADGGFIAADVAASTMARASRLGEYVSIIQSTITYTLPVTFDLPMNGSKVVAISVEQNLQTFLDHMNFSSFGGAANIYLAQNGGRVISTLTTDTAAVTFNVLSLFEGSDVECMNDPAISRDAMTTTDRQLTFRMSNPSGDSYVVVTPIETRQEDLILFYLVPEAIVNRTLNDFSGDITSLSMIIIAVLTTGMLLAFLALYRDRKRKFDEELVSRDRTFDLLVANANTAFALLSTTEPAPIYLSTNAADIMGTQIRRLSPAPKGFRLEAETDEGTDKLQAINGDLANWDGKSVFASAYIARGAGVQDEYYQIRLYPAEGIDDEFAVIIQDVTEQVRREDMVKNALYMAERANEAKTKFLSNISHDIRTPMNAIVNMTRFAIESRDDPKTQVKYLNTIAKSADHLLRLINDVLDMSRIESGQAVIEKEPFNIQKEVQRVADITRPLCQAKRQIFHCDFSGLRVRGVRGDHVKVAQVLMNLLSNAVKYTPEGGDISFTVTELPSLREGIAVLRFVVRDNGIGIPEDNQKNIFRPFVRADDKRVSKLEGTGLGLSICQSYVNAMGGIISCASKEGAGSAFTVELFFEEAKIEPEKPAPLVEEKEAPFAGKRCLLCEDNRINQVIAKKLLEAAGFTVEIASDGQEGVTCFERSEPGAFDIIYMDIQMPKMNGYEATGMIRQSKHTQAGTIPILAMTANVFAEDVEKARIAGMNGHLGKPVDPKLLISETERVLNAKEEGR